MLKKFSVLALTGMLCLPAAAFAGGGGDLANKIDDLTRQLEQLKRQMAEMQTVNESIEEKAESWDLASRIHFSGDYRARIDYLNADTKSHYSATDVADTLVSNALVAFGNNQQNTYDALVAGLFGLPPEQRAAALTGFAGFLGGTPVAARDYENETNWTNRFRLNMRVKALEAVEFKGRLAMYKTWGMQNNPLGQDPFGPFTLSSLAFDGNATRTSGGSELFVDRAFMNWNNVGGYPMWISVGRRPTSGGPPSQLRVGADQRMATPTAFMDYPFDGATLGYAYNGLPGLENFPGRIRFCYGRGFEAGPTFGDSGLNDVDFAGFNWDVYKKSDRFFNLQVFGAFNMFNVPDNVTFPNPLEIAIKDNLPAATQVSADLIDDVIDLANIAAGSANGILDRANLGDIYHTSFVFMDKYETFNYFLAGAWSHTNPRGWDEAGNSLLVSWWGDLTEKDGYSIYLGGRYDFPDVGLKIGLEYNYGTEDWISFTPGHDDLYQAKLATRGSVYEIYGIWDIPSEAISKFGRAFMRLGYMHYDYDYTGSGYWLGAPVDSDQLLTTPLNAQFYAPLDEMDQVYLTMEMFF